MRVAIIGCGNIKKIHRFSGMSESETSILIDGIGKLLADSDVDIVIAPARGVPYEVAKAYKKYGGKKVIGAVPFDDVDFGLNHIADYRNISDEDVNIGDWYDLNGRIASWGDVVICIGMSTGAICDIAMLKYHYKYKGCKTNLVIFKNTISQLLPKELEEELKNLYYITSLAELKPFLKLNRKFYIPFTSLIQPMGRIKTMLIKRTVNSLLARHPDRFKDNFEENKKLIDGVAEVNSKKLRNVIAGYLTRLVKKQKSEVLLK